MAAMTRCPDEGMLRCYLDQQLPPGEQTAVGQHVAGCADCAAALAALGDTAALARSALDRLAVPAPVPAAAWQRFTARYPLRGPSARGAGDRLSATLYWRLETMTRTLRLRWQPALFGVALAALLIAVFAVAPLRAAAGQFLDIFRVHKLAVVQVDPGQLEQLSKYKDQILSQPKFDQAKPQRVASAAEASGPAGFQVLTPGFVPGGLSQPSEVSVEPAGHAQTTVNLAAARELLRSAGLPTNSLPAGDRIEVTTDIKPVVAMVYGGAGDARRLVVIQGASPDVNVPAGVDVAQLGELGLELLGMTPDAARQFSRNIDWTTTLVLPIPRDMASVEEVKVRGVTGYFMKGTAQTAGKQGPGSALIWQDHDQLYMVGGDYSRQVLSQVAESLK